MMVTLSLLAPGTAPAQGHVELAKKIERGLKAKDAKRKLKESINGGHYVDQQWAADVQKVTVIINEYASPEEATEMVAVGEGGRRGWKSPGASKG